jgi:hypothetical protein
MDAERARLGASIDALTACARLGIPLSCVGRADACLSVASTCYTTSALAQQTWWMLARSSSLDADAVLGTCEIPTGGIPSPGDFYKAAKTAGMSPEIADKGGRS